MYHYIFTLNILNFYLIFKSKTSPSISKVRISNIEFMVEIGIFRQKLY